MLHGNYIGKWEKVQDRTGLELEHTLVRTGSFFIHFKAAILQYSGLNCIKTKYASKTFYTPFVLFNFSYKNMQISN